MRFKELPAGEVAAMDQGFAAEDKILDGLIAEMRKQAAEDGEGQALCNTALMLWNAPVAQTAPLLLSALRRLAFHAGS